MRGASICELSSYTNPVMARFGGGDAGFNLVILVASIRLRQRIHLRPALSWRSIAASACASGAMPGPDNRAPSGFEDGISNPRDQPPEERMYDLVYVGETMTSPRLRERNLSRVSQGPPPARGFLQARANATARRCSC